MHGHNKVAMWLGAVASWPPMRIAVACRLHREARFALRVGAMGDPTLCRLKDIYATAAATDAYGAEWQGLHALPVRVVSRSIPPPWRSIRISFFPSSRPPHAVLSTCG